MNKSYEFDDMFNRAFDRALKRIEYRESLKDENLPKDSWLRAEKQRVIEGKKSKEEQDLEAEEAFDKFYEDYTKRFGKSLWDKGEEI